MVFMLKEMQFIVQKLLFRFVNLQEKKLHLYLEKQRCIFDARIKFFRRICFISQLLMFDVLEKQFTYISQIYPKFHKIIPFQNFQLLYLLFCMKSCKKAHISSILAVFKLLKRERKLLNLLKNIKKQTKRSLISRKIGIMFHNCGCPKIVGPLYNVLKHLIFPKTKTILPKNLL